MATQQSGLVSGNAQNAPGGQTKQNHSSFNESYSFFQTERFAEYVPFTVMEGVSGDKLPLHSNHEVQTYNLKSPILQSLSKKKDYFVVPMQAILPLNWEKFFTNPNIGQDVPDDCGLGVEDFWNKIKTLCTNSWTKLTTDLSGTISNPSAIEEWLKFLLFFENIYSTGSLMETLGISGHNWIRIYDSNQAVSRFVVWDEMFDRVVSAIAADLDYDPSSRYITLSLGGNTYLIVGDDGSGVHRSGQISLREAIELMRDDLSFTISAASMGSSFNSDIKSFGQDFSFTYPTTDAPLNLGRLWAYQLVVSHFYSNDHVDFIYSAELFRQYIREVGTRNSNTGGSYVHDPCFSVNGLQYHYDALSARIFNNVISNFTSNGIFGYTSSTSIYGRSDDLNEAYAYFVALFSFKRSLRFMDYFTGSRSLPLAVGDHECNVNSNNAVDIIELSRASMMTKFLQAVNRSGRKFSNYMKELFGKTPAYDYHNPMYLAHTSDLVGAQETDNTADAQMQTKLAVTSRLRASSSRFAFEFYPDRDCIVIGISYYDLPRVYTRATERQNFVLDRFDMFNPYLQFIGDQGIYQAEIGTDTPLIGSGTDFSYTNRHMEYKQRYNQACGGFCVPSTGLDHWIFSADELRRQWFHNISPSFIRSFNSEIDKFYQGLTGYSLGTYFHFIVRYDNRMHANRPMAYNPVITV